MENNIIRVAGYVKLAKLWERSEEEARIYHREYYENMANDVEDIELVDVYIDITGNKHIYARTEMLRLIRDCRDGKVDCILAQTKGYLAADHFELCCLLRFLFELPSRIDIVTEDELFQVDTITNEENQREELYNMAVEFTNIAPGRHYKWIARVNEAIEKLNDACELGTTDNDKTDRQKVTNDEQ